MDITPLERTVRSLRARAERVAWYAPATAYALEDAADEFEHALQETLEKEPSSEVAPGETKPDDRWVDGRNAFNNVWCYRTMPHPLDDEG